MTSSGGCHQFKGTSGKKLTDDRHQDTADQSQGDGGMNSFGHFLVVLPAA